MNLDFLALVKRVELLEEQIATVLNQVETLASQLKTAAPAPAPEEAKS